ncbi:MAG: AAA family ATPase [Flavobacteriaceae bacterium]|nr:AAA family ATPase [Flavobacteriaceae bacterium]
MTNNRKKILSCIGAIYEASKDCGLEKVFFEKMDAECCFLAGYFGTSKTQAFFVGLVFAFNQKGETADHYNLIAHFACNPMKLLEYYDDFAHLIDSQMINKRRTITSFRVHKTSDSYSIHPKITEAILNNKNMPQLVEDDIKDVFQLLEKLYQLGEQCRYGDISLDEMLQETETLLDAYKQFPFVTYLLRLDLSPKNLYTYLHLIWKTIVGNTATNLGSILEILYETTSQQVKQTQQFLHGENDLLQRELIELEGANFFSDTSIQLSSNSNEALSSFGIQLFTAQKQRKNLILPDRIVARKLHFDPKEMKQLFVLKKLLSKQQFTKTQKQLAEKSLPSGITVLLHGFPGTGKTECIKQLAKETNRALVKVDFSQTKSKWFGESEKLVKGIFSDYKAIAIELENTPILLFNEADALLSKRKAHHYSNTGQTENTIQNILLEELENFEGIFVATTNLVGQLDKAFERRFLFKIPFELPTIAIGAKIWQSKIPQLSQSQSKLLATRFAFSGGQIENVVRKHEIHQIMYSEKTSFTQLTDFCLEETLVQPKEKIGFTNIL